MYHVVLPRDGSDGVPHYKEGHWDLMDWGETLQGDLPPERQQESFGSIGSNWEGEVGMKNVHLPVPVDHEEGKALHLGRIVHYGGEEPQVVVESLRIP